MVTVASPSCSHRLPEEVPALWNACRAAQVEIKSKCACCGAPLATAEQRTCSVCQEDNHVVSRS